MKTCNERPLTSRPTVRPGSPWSFPQCLVETLPTGLTVVRVPMPGQRIVTMEIGLDAPLCTEPAGLGGRWIRQLCGRRAQQGPRDQQVRHTGALPTRFP